MPAMPCAFIASAWSGLSRRASSPPCTLGCSVLTRPSIISGKWVISETSLTASPASRSALAVPPVEIRATPCPARPLAKSINPVLSETDKRAREILRSVMDGVSRMTRWPPLLSLHDLVEKGQTHACTQRIRHGDRDKGVAPVENDVSGNPVQLQGRHHGTECQGSQQQQAQADA